MRFWIFVLFQDVLKRECKGYDKDNGFALVVAVYDE